MSEAPDAVRIGLVATSDRASQGVYKDEGIPALEQWLAAGPVPPVVTTRSQARSSTSSFNVASIRARSSGMSRGTNSTGFASAAASHCSSAGMPSSL